MPLEITTQAQLSCQKGGSTVTGNTTKQLTLAGNGMYANSQVIGLSPVLIAYPADLIAEGATYVYIKNEGTNAVELYVNSGGTQPFSRLLAGDISLVRSATANPGHYAAAFVAPSTIKIVSVGT